MFAAPSLNAGLESFEHALCDQLGLGLGCQLLADHDELVAAETAQRIRAAQHTVESCGDPLQELVAGLVSKGVVDRLEVVDVDEQHRDLPARARAAREHLFQAVADQRPFGSPVSASWVAMNESSSSRRVSSASVRSRSASKHLAISHEAELEAQLDDRLRLRERLG